MQTFIKVRYDFPATHYYKDASGNHAYLKHEHRHIFYVVATIEVFHDDRELEFFAVRDTIEKYLFSQYYNHVECRYTLGQRSCEQVAANLLQHLLEKFGTRSYKIEVSEDNENGSIVIGGSD